MSLKYLFLFFLLLNLTSCVGYAILSGTGQSEFDSKCNGHYACINEQVLIKQFHGEPSEIIIKNNKEYWVYNKKLAFRGVLLGLIFPIPLMIPVGYDKVIIEFENGQRSRTTVDNRSETTSAFLCGFIPSGHRGVFGCYVK